MVDLQRRVVPGMELENPEEAAQEAAELYVEVARQSARRACLMAQARGSNVVQVSDLPEHRVAPTLVNHVEVRSCCSDQVRPLGVLFEGKPCCSNGLTKERLLRFDESDVGSLWVFCDVCEA